MILAINKPALIRLPEDLSKNDNSKETIPKTFIFVSILASNLFFYTTIICLIYNGFNPSFSAGGILIILSLVVSTLAPFMFYTFRKRGEY